MGVTSLSFSHFEPSVFVTGMEGGCVLKCSTAVETVAVLQKGSSFPLKAPAQFVFSPHGGPVYSVNCSPFHRQVKVHLCNLNSSWLARQWRVRMMSPARTVASWQVVEQFIKGLCEFVPLLSMENIRT